MTALLPAAKTGLDTDTIIKTKTIIQTGKKGDFTYRPQIT
jgi:hypothetical protein